MFKVIGFLGAFALSGAAAQAGQTLYECTVNYGEIGKTKGVNLLIAQTDGSKEAMVVDGVIMEHKDGVPARAKVVMDNSKKVTFAWTVRNIPNRSGQVASLSYRATWVRSAKRMNVHLKPLGGYNNHFQGTGGCRVSRK